ncbi:MAG: serine O-acetyltransferase [Candidatus Omnitrophica bacterium]|nr:serine O-acetyltransferase [Candidatus Omnitrophota bacterium]
MTFFLLLLFIGFLALLAGYFRPEIDACFERDPAATNTVEVLLSYSGLHSLMWHHLNRQLYLWRIPILPRFISQWVRFFTGIEIHPGAVVGRGCFIDHGMGVVIGETAVLGKNVTLYQGVTLGGTGKEKGKRHPTLGDNIVIGAGAKILGNIRIGNNVLIGANAVVVRDVPPNSTVVGIPGRVSHRQGRRLSTITLDHSGLPDPLAQSLEQLQRHMEHLEEELEKWRQKTGEKKDLEEE